MFGLADELRNLAWSVEERGFIRWCEKIRATLPAAFETLRAGDLETGYAAIAGMLDSAPPVPRLLAGGSPVLGATPHTIAGRSVPLWRGERAKCLLVTTEKPAGFGDTIMSCRFIVAARERVDHVIVAAHPALHRLLLQIAGVDEVVAPGDLASVAERVNAYWHCWWLPCRVGGGYGPARYIACADRQRGEALRVGVAWAAGEVDTHGRARCVPIAALAPLAEAPGVELHSLQVGPSAADARLADMALVEHELHDFEDTRALIETLDLTITIDTSVAHLAAATGRPTLIVLPHAADWRWGVRPAERTPWYPSAKLFWQSTPGDWRPVVERVAAELRAAETH